MASLPDMMSERGHGAPGRGDRTIGATSVTPGETPEAGCRVTLGFAMLDGDTDRNPATHQEAPMTADTDIELGPIDYLVVEWSADRPPTGQALPMLVDLVERGIIRILDLRFVQVQADGTLAGLDISDMDGDGANDLLVFEGATSGLLDDEDLAEAAKTLTPGSAAALLVYENTWAAPFATALRKGGAQLVAGGRIPVNALLAQLDALEASGA
jgi:hypothetical protein